MEGGVIVFTHHPELENPTGRKRSTLLGGFGESGAELENPVFLKNTLWVKLTPGGGKDPIGLFLVIEKTEYRVELTALA